MSIRGDSALIIATRCDAQYAPRGCARISREARRLESKPEALFGADFFYVEPIATRRSKGRAVGPAGPLPRIRGRLFGNEAVGPFEVRRRARKFRPRWAGT